MKFFLIVCIWFFFLCGGMLDAAFMKGSAFYAFIFPPYGWFHTIEMTLDGQWRDTMMCHMTPGVTCTYHIPRYCFENPIDCKTGGMLPDNVTVDFNTNTLYIDGVRQINPNEVDPNN